MANELVSAVITTYKRSGEMLKECLDSVVGQTYRPIEIILVDDNPEEAPEKAEVAALAATYDGLRLISHQVNSGAQVSRNDGIRAAKGAFIAFLDDDDIWLPEKIEKQMPLFADESVGMVYCRGYQTEGDIQDHSAPYSRFFLPECTHRSLLAFDDIGTTSQAVIRKSCFDVVGLFDEEMPARQDYEMWLRISTRYRLLGSPEFLYVRRMHAAGQISKSREKAKVGILRIYRKYKAEYRRDRKARALCFWQISSHQLFEHTAFRWKYRIRALLTDPVVIYQRLQGREHVKL